MKKSNWIILGVLVVASIFFLWLWYYLQFNLVDDPFDLVLTIVWWALVIVACVAIHKAEKRRQERVRTTYVAADSLFNSEAGVVALTGATPADAIAQTLAGLKYNFNLEDMPEDTTFNYVVRSKEFEVEKQSGQGAGEAADGADGAGTAQPTIKKWEGEVVDVANPDADPKQFSNEDELKAILAA